MKKKNLLAMILTCALAAGAMSVSASAAGYDGANGTGTGKVEITTATSPIIIDPTDPDPDNPDPSEELKELVKLVNQDIVFETTALSKATNRTHTNPIPQQTVSGVQDRVGVGVNDQTAYLTNQNKWNLTVKMGEFKLVDKGTVTAVDAMPGFGIELVNAGVKGVAGSNNDFKAVANDLLQSSSNLLTADLNSPRKVMAANANGSPGHWVGTWDAKLLTGNTVRGGESVADMVWTVSVGL